MRCHIRTPRSAAFGGGQGVLGSLLIEGCRGNWIMPLEGTNVLAGLIPFNYFQSVQELCSQFLQTALSCSFNGMKMQHFSALFLHATHVFTLKLFPVLAAKWKGLRPCLTLNTISLFRGTITKVGLANSFNSYWLPCWRPLWLDALPLFAAAVPHFLFHLSF